jgi:uncharacterized protein (TIGR01440 family)
MELERIEETAAQAAKTLFSHACLKRDDILIVGCSTSEIFGRHIGSFSSLEAAEAIYRGIYPRCEAAGVYLAAQCCEHLNRSIVCERACMEKYNLAEALAVPALHAGGAFAMTVMKNAKAPVLVERIRAHAGIDIGATLIGMHLREVAVPVRGAARMGEATLVMARTRPRYVGGPRACYPEGE